MIASDTCIALIKHFESCKLDAYSDIAGVSTIGWGTIRYENGANVKLGDSIPQFKADVLLAWEVNNKARSVQSMIATTILKQCQFDSLVSFAYNEGAGALANSTLLKKIKINPADPFINDCFLMWDKAKVNGVLKEVLGLKLRRQSESWLYFNNEFKIFN